jgi:hypothetical protein
MSEQDELNREIPDPVTESPTAAAQPVAADLVDPEVAPLTKAPERPKYAPPAGPRPPGSAIAVEKSLNFGPSLKRLLGHLGPERMIIGFSILLAVSGIVLNVIGPKILGWATDVIFTGVIGKQLPAGATKEQVVESLRAQGQDTFADMAVRGQLAAALVAGISAERGSAALDLPDAQRGAGKGQPAAAVLLRPLAAR